jgi:hypothetical protein
MGPRATLHRVRRFGTARTLARFALLAAVLAVVACNRPQSDATAAQASAPTPQTRAARTAAARNASTPLAHLPTAIIYVDAAGTPVWPTPPPACATSTATVLRADLGPTIGEAPIWVSSVALPIVPWRNEFIRTHWLVESGAPGDLTIAGRRVDGDGTARFIRQGAEGVSEQLRVASAGAPRPGRAGDEARPFVDYAVYLVLPGPGCWELTARIGEASRTMRIFVYA